MTFELFVTFLLGALNIEYTGRVDPDTELYEEIGLDSLQAFQMIIAIEQRASLDVPVDDIPAIYTLADAFEYYNFAKSLAETSTDSAT